MHRDNVVMVPCANDEKYNEKWEVTEHQQLRHMQTKLCLDTENLNPQDHVFATECDEKKESQKWLFAND